MIQIFRRSSTYIIVLIIVVGGFIVLQLMSAKKSDQIEPSNTGFWENYNVETMNIAGTAYKLVVADTPQKREKGLMFVRKQTAEYDGMVFRFPDKDIRNFWNKNTFVDLQLYWMLDGEVIGTSDLPSIEKSNDYVIISSPSPTDTVVEIIQ